MPAPPQAFGCGPEGLSYARFGREGGGRLTLLEHRTEALPPDTFAKGLLGGPPREPEIFAERVAQFLGGLSSVGRRASLVVPDAWLRTTFLALDEVPSSGAAREEVLRWKLKRQVPFRVDELRVRGVELSNGARVSRRPAWLPSVRSSDDPAQAPAAETVEAEVGAPVGGAPGDDGPASPEGPGYSMPPAAEAGAVPEASSGDAAGAHRLLVGYGIESLLSHLEAAFGGAGVQLGRITNAGLASLASLAEPLRRRSVALVLVTEGSYTLVAAEGGEPVLHRYKELGEGLGPGAMGHLVVRDLRLTRTFLADRLSGGGLERLVLLAPDDEVPRWAGWLEEGLDRPVELIEGAHLEGLASVDGLPPWHRLTPLAGAVLEEVR